LRVLEALIGLVDFLELVLAGVVARIAVGMELHGELAEGALEFLVVRAFAHTERFVEISLHLKPVMVLLPDGSKSAETAIPCRSKRLERFSGYRPVCRIVMRLKRTVP